MHDRTHSPTLSRSSLCTTFHSRVTFRRRHLHDDGNWCGGVEKKKKRSTLSSRNFRALRDGVFSSFSFFLISIVAAIYVEVARVGTCIAHEEEEKQERPSAVSLAMAMAEQKLEKYSTGARLRGPSIRKMEERRRPGVSARGFNRWSWMSARTTSAFTGPRWTSDKKDRAIKYDELNGKPPHRFRWRKRANHIVWTTHGNAKETREFISTKILRLLREQ